MALAFECVLCAVCRTKMIRRVEFFNLAECVCDDRTEYACNMHAHDMDTEHCRCIHCTQFKWVKFIGCHILFSCRSAFAVFHHICSFTREYARARCYVCEDLKPQHAVLALVFNAWYTLPLPTPISLLPCSCCSCWCYYHLCCCFCYCFKFPVALYFLINSRVSPARIHLF